MTPIFQTSTYVQEAVGVHKGWEYSRSHNPTRAALETAFAELEGGTHGLAFASGLAAIDTVLKTLKPGDEVIAGQDLYGGTARLFRTNHAPMGIVFHFVDTQDPSLVEAAITDKTKLVWLESPTNPLMQITDIRAIADLTKPAASCSPWTIRSPHPCCSVRWSTVRTSSCTRSPSTSAATAMW